MVVDAIDQYRTGGAETQMDASETKVEQELVRSIVEKVQEARSHRQQRSSSRVQGVRYWRGEQWLSRKQRKRRGKKWTEAVVNETFPIIEQQIAMMTDNNPTGVFVAKEHSDVQFATDIQDLVRLRARQINMRTKLIRACHDAKLFGEMAAKVFWNDTLGKPDVDVLLIHPEHLLIDPLATGVDDAEYVGTEREVLLDYAIQRWPEHKKKLEQLADTDFMEGRYESVADTTSLDAELGQVETRQDYASGQDDKRRAKKVKLVELYYCDYSEQEVEIVTPLEILQEDGRVVPNAAGQLVYVDTGELYSTTTAPTMKVSEAIYPDGRVTILAGDRVILEDAPWQGLWPIVIGINAVIPHRWYGMSEVEQIRESQDIINDTTSKIQDHISLALHPRRKVETGALADPKSLRNTPDAIIRVNPGRMKGVEWEDTPRLSGDAWNVLEFAQRNMQHTAGMPAQSMGRTPDRQATATEIATLERAGRGRVGMTSALLDEFIACIFLLMGQVIQQNYDVGRIVRVIGDEGQDRAITIVEQHKTVKYDVEVEAGSTLPYDKQQRKEDALALFNVLQLAYLPELLDAYEVKNKEQVLQRHQEYMMFQQFGSVLMIPEVQQMLVPYVQAVQNQGEQKNE